jgi:biotin operon repressor
MIMAAAGLAFVLASAPAWAEIDWAQVDSVLERKGAEQPGGIHRYSFPRSDLKVTLDGVPIKPALALGGWVAFEPIGDQAMMMGDLVLTEEEVNPVMQHLVSNGIEITAVHNHLLRASPATLYMHVLGHGDPTALATALREGLIASKTPPASTTSSQTQSIDLDTAMIDKALGAKGKVNGGVYQVNVPRAEAVKDGGMDIPPAMGSAIAINFQPTGGGKAATTGDFVLTSKEVNPVLRALRENGIEVTALHSHMLDEQPRLFFMHFWAVNDVSRLTEGLKAALSNVNAKTN